MQGLRAILTKFLVPKSQFYYNNHDLLAHLSNFVNIEQMFKSQKTNF